MAAGRATASAGPEDVKGAAPQTVPGPVVGDLFHVEHRERFWRQFGPLTQEHGAIPDEFTQALPHDPRSFDGTGGDEPSLGRVQRDLLGKPALFDGAALKQSQFAQGEFEETGLLSRAFDHVEAQFGAGQGERQGGKPRAASDVKQPGRRAAATPDCGQQAERIGDVKPEVFRVAGRDEGGHGVPSLYEAAVRLQGIVEGREVEAGLLLKELKTAFPDPLRPGRAGLGFYVLSHYSCFELSDRTCVVSRG